MGCGLSKAHIHSEVLVSHASARTTFHGRLLMVRRRQAGWPVAHIAAAMGVSRKCVTTWVNRYASDGEAGLHDRSSRPHRMPTRTPAEVEQRIVELRRDERRGPDWIGAELGVPARTVSRVLARHGVPRLASLDPITGEVIRASKHTAVRYERERPGELVHMDVKKLGRIPDGGGWRAHGRGLGGNADGKKGTGFDYVHSLVDDHSRLAYSEILADEKGPTCAAFLTRAIDYFAAHGIDTIERLMTDNAWAYRYSARGLCSGRHQAGLHPPALPVAERQGRAPQPHLADGMGLPADLPHQQRPRSCPCPLARALQHSTSSQRTQRGLPPLSRLLPT